VPRRAPRPVPAARPRPRAAAHAKLPRLFFVFVACLAIIAVGRISLSFAVVQKSLQTDNVARAVSQLQIENNTLGESIARKAAGTIIREKASILGLVPAAKVTYLTVHTQTSRAVAKPSEAGAR
jgi:hypothetical protein